MIVGATDAPLPMIPDAGTVGDQLSVPQLLVEGLLAEAERALSLTEAPAAAALGCQRPIHAPQVVGRQPNPAWIERRLLLRVEEAAAAPASDHGPGDAELGRHRGDRDPAIASGSVRLRDDRAGRRDPVTVTHLADPRVGPGQPHPCPQPF